MEKRSREETEGEGRKVKNRAKRWGLERRETRVV